MTSSKTIARVVGGVYLAGFVVGIGGSIMTQSVLGAPDHLATIAANSMVVAIGAILWLLAVVGDAAHGVLLYPILKPHSERAAVGYLAGRIADAMFIAIMVLCILAQIPLGGEYLKAAAGDTANLQALSALLSQVQLYTYELGMSTLGIAGLVLCLTLYRAALLPRWLAAWGIAGYAIILCGMLSAIMGSGLGDLSSIPGGLWEVFAGGWLIVKGFSLPAPLPATAERSPQAANAPTA